METWMEFYVQNPFFLVTSGGVMIHNGIPFQTLWSRCPAPSLRASCIFAETTGYENAESTGSQADSLGAAAPPLLNCGTGDKYNPLSFSFPSCLVHTYNTVYFIGLLGEVPDELHVKPRAQQVIRTQ